MLTSPKLVLRNLTYHARGNLAVLLGVAVGSAVLTGALLVGDSLRGSLRARVERQLGGIDAVAFFPRPMRAEVADGLPGSVAPVLLLSGSVQAAGDATAPALGRVTVLGVDDRFKPAGVGDVDWKSAAKQIVLSPRVAEKLGAKAGDTVRLGVEQFSDLPRSSSLAKRGAADATSTEEFTVAAVLPAAAAENDFNLTPNPAAPLNVFVPIRTLTRLTAPKSQGRTAADYPERLATVLLATGAAVNDLDAALRPRLEPRDYGLRLEDRESYVSAESRELVLGSQLVTATEAAAKELGLRSERTVVYVGYTLTYDGQELPYPIIAGLNPTAAPPLGPFLPPGVTNMADGDIVLVNWTGRNAMRLPLAGVPVGAKVELTYFHPDVEGDGKKLTTTLAVRGFLPTEGVSDDKFLTPEIRGVTDRDANLYNWDRPPMLAKDDIKRRIPDNSPRARFWTAKKATPSAYVNLATAEKLFAGRYGSITSVRIAPAPGETAEQAQVRLQAALLKHLDPKAAGLVFDPIRQRLLTASRGGNDFGMLFLGFSCFLIAAALMLVGLLFRLSLDRRAKEIGLLLATGFAVKHVRRLLLTEGLIVATVGAVIGLAAGVAYNRLLLTVLLDLWPDSEVRTYLKPYATPLSFVIGFASTVAMAFGALWWSARGLVKVAPPALLRGETAVVSVAVARSKRFPSRLTFVLLTLAIMLNFTGSTVRNPDYQAMSFFGCGGFLLAAALSGVRWWMNGERHGAVNGRGLSALAQLGVRNATRNPTRSLLTATLLASAAFLLVAVESFRRQPDQEFSEKTGGSGGFNVIAETDVPLFQTFSGGPGRADLEMQLKRAYAPKDGDPDAPPETPAYREMKAEVDSSLEEVYPLRLRGGDDASCMNLFQAGRPRVLGVPQALITGEKRFKFYETLAKTAEEKANPWRLLDNPGRSGPIPVFCEQNTAQWMLKKAVGDEYTMPGDDGTDVTFRIVGTLVDSPFQSELIISEDEFARIFPKQNGYRTFLVRTAPGKEAAVAHALEVAFRANGLTATPTRDRVASYQAVIGAYLSTFQLLGGFGLLLGVLGLAVVILRGVWECLGELALLRAVGYRTRALQFLVLVENALLLLIGLGSGVLAALASVAPHVADGAAVPWLRLAGMLGLVLAVGFVVATIATAGILRVPVIPALRKE